MAIRFLQKVAKPEPVAHVSEDTPYTILTALDELSKGRSGTLMLVNIASGVGYQVVIYDPDTRRAKLKGPTGAYLNPVIGEREVPQYQPVWR